MAITLVGLCIQLGGAVLAQLHLPAVVSLTIKNVAGGNTMCAMMLVGTVLAQTDLKTIAEGQVLRYCAVRLLSTVTAALSCPNAPVSVAAAGSPGA